MAYLIQGAAAAAAEYTSSGVVQLDTVNKTAFLLLPFPVYTAGHLAKVLGHIVDVGEGHTRLAMRALVSVDLLEELTDRGVPHGFAIESRILLAGDMAAYAFVFFARNAADRRTSASMGALQSEMIAEVHATGQKDAAQVLRDLEGRIDVCRITAESSAADKKRTLEMFHASFTDYLMKVEDKVRDLVHGSAHVFLGARAVANGLLYSACAGSRKAIVVTHDRTFVMWELGKSIKLPFPPDDPRFERIRALNAALKLHLLHRAATAAQPVDLVYCETRMAMRAPNQINHSLGMHYRGFLEKTLRVHGAEDLPEHELDAQPYRNLGIWALTAPEIRAVGASVAGLLAAG